MAPIITTVRVGTTPRRKVDIHMTKLLAGVPSKLPPSSARWGEPITVKTNSSSQHGLSASRPHGWFGISSKAGLD